jgi:hypothetical protein
LTPEDILSAVNALPAAPAAKQYAKLYRGLLAGPDTTVETMPMGAVRITCGGERWVFTEFRLHVGERTEEWVRKIEAIGRLAA